MNKIVRPLQIFTDLSKIGRTYALQNGFDPHSFWEQNIVWGDLDSFQHVNNVRYLRLFESGRMRWLRELAIQADGEQAAENLVKGRGISLILKKIDLDFKRPVNFPDTLLIAHKFKPVSSDPAHLLMHAIAYSNEQQRVVTESTATCVWYDYDRLAKAVQGPPPSFAAVVQKSMSGMTS
ncbi:hypothetical protein FRC14_006171 [Serendipita sp. 396]|nr:hypothetical protein FRC14_006171 [Serendipita sp. 396]KAG8866594.1 hypothetical protein FRC20_008041 [Serendipita sp. 405]